MVATLAWGFACEAADSPDSGSPKGSEPGGGPASGHSAGAPSTGATAAPPGSGAGAPPNPDAVAADGKDPGKALVNPDKTPVKKITFDSSGDPSSGAFHHAASTVKAAELGSATAAGDAERSAQEQRSISRTERSLASSIAKDYDRINAYSSPRTSSPDPAIRAQGHQYLAQKVTPAPEHARYYEALELNSNGDVLKKGPEYVHNLAEASEKHETLADHDFQQARQAENAIAKMKDFDKTLDRRDSAMHSMEEQKFFARNKTTTSSANPDISSADASRGPAAAADTKKINPDNGGSKEQNPSEKKPDFSLREHLADIFAKKKAPLDAQNAHEEKSKATTSDFDGIFHSSATANPGTGKKEGAASSAGADSSQNASTFQMLGSENEREIKTLMGNLEQQIAGSPFGSADQSIFVRMSAYLMKAQSEKRVR